MSDKFEVVIVGAGVAGSTAAYILASAGLEVLLIERGNYAGSKNMTGGRLYSHSLNKIIPNFAKEAPVERKITKEKVSLLTEDSAITLDYHSSRLGGNLRDSYSVLRGEFDQWLAQKAEEAGAVLAAGVRVDELLTNNGKVVGVKAGEDEIEADVVVLADGVNSLLAQQIGLKKELQPHEVAVGAKEVIELPKQVIEDRFNLNEEEGAAWLFAGSCTSGIVGGGFIYTNKSSLSLGIVCTLSDIANSVKSVCQMVEDFKMHPAIKPLIKGGKLLEYSGHLVPEAGYDMVPQLYGDGVVIVGDAAGLVINVGYTVRGMDLAITSAEAAAKVIIKAREKGDFSKNSLATYKQFLDQSFVIKDMKLYKNFPHFMQNKRIFNDYPKLVDDILAGMFIVDGSTSKPLRKKVMDNLKTVGLMTLLKDSYKGMKAL
ncbi:dehydrogenases [Pelotomaculum thermopropionicum SI]|uniref:Dehydrogenases n=1 Tax=Pelotomaculum thermopropionicum (strain DSM 13744 / JCM 10971 / SI) TaxID=370438 RepID=A5CZH7_PELTS|nr:dehydrogenases [Pelotomaculum thermopropionicum SI]